MLEPPKFEKPEAMESVIGWREWLQLPELRVARIKVKVDTGARSCSLHAFDLEIVLRDGIEFARFEIHPYQASERRRVLVEVPVVEYRNVRSSSGHLERRPVIRTSAVLNSNCWPIEITLTKRDQMGFRMLLGRQALAGRFVVDPSRSFVQSSKAKS